MVDVTAFQSHGETILDLVDHDTGAQLSADRCVECGEDVFENTLFALDYDLEPFTDLSVMVLEAV
jgi:hypothetical protein